MQDERLFREEAESVHRAQQGDRVALDALLASQLPALRVYVRSQMPSELRAHESTSDVVQSVCREVLAQERFQYQGAGQFRCWLYRAVAYRIRSKLRRLRAECRDPGRIDTSVDPDFVARISRVPSPSLAATRREDVERVEKAFERLNESDAEILGLRYMADVPVPDIARSLEITEDAAHKRLGRARRRLARAFAELGAEEAASSSPR